MTIGPSEGPIGYEAHQRYASDQEQVVQAFVKQYHMPPSAVKDVAARAQLLISLPTFPAIDMLLGTYLGKTYASFRAPANYFVQGSCPSEIAPSLGPPEKLDADISKINIVTSEKPEAEEDGETIINMALEIKHVNEAINFARSRMKQFLQA